MNILFNLLIPVCVMVTLNVCIYRTMRRFRPSAPSAPCLTTRRASSTLAAAGRIFHPTPQQQQQLYHNQTHLRPFHLNAGGGGASDRSRSPVSNGGGGAVAGDDTGMRRLGGNEKELKKRDGRYTRASVVMVVVYVVCNAPRLIPNCMELFLRFNQFPDVSSRRIYQMAIRCNTHDCTI